MFWVFFILVSNIFEREYFLLSNIIIDSHEGKELNMNGMRTSKKLFIFMLLATAFLLVIIHKQGMIRASDETDQTEATDQAAAELVITSEKDDTEETVTETQSTETRAEKKSLTENKEKITKKKKTSAKNRTAEKSENGQTILDVSKGNIKITAAGAAGGGLDTNETSLNPKGYWISGTTTQYNVIVAENVTTHITLDSVDITCSMAKKTCIDVSHADVTITLIGENKLLCNAGTTDNQNQGGAALAKEGMDDHMLVIQCEYADEEGHECDAGCGSLLAKGAQNLYHTGAIGSTISNASDAKKTGFGNLKIRGGNIEALAGQHTPGIGSACVSQSYKGGYTKNIWITGGNVKAIGTSYGSGIGSGYGNRVDGIFITGGIVEATGGEYAPGIGASSNAGSSTQTGETMNVKISGGNTIVTAIGDSATNMPGIGSAQGNGKVSNVTASPDQGYQGYIQDGTSLTDYAFMEGTPIHAETNIKVGRFYTKVYFGPYRDVNEIEQVTKEQIGANHVISKSGGEPFTEKQLKILTKVTGKTKDGANFADSQLTLFDREQLEEINKAKTAGEIGEFPLTYETPNGTKVTVTVYLRNDGTDGAEFDPQKPSPSLGANDFTKETGGDPFTEDEIKALGELKGKNEEGVNIDLKDFTVDGKQMEQINNAKQAGKAGTFDLTYTSPDGKNVTVSVTLTGEYDEIVSDPVNNEMIKAMNIISKTGGKEFSEEQVIFFSKVKAFDENGDEISADQLSVKNNGQLEDLNKAKKNAKTGNFPLTFQTQSGTEVTITVYLTDEGTDGAEITPQDGTPMIGANHGKKETGGKGFGQEEIIALCSAKGKNKYGDSEKIQADEIQLKVINTAKQAGRTGIFDLVFSMKDGTKVNVKVTLTGIHKVVFDSDGGNYTPEPQPVTGGGYVREPEEPSKEGYTFEGWYYTDENGQEKKWNFGDPLNQDITLTAKWKKHNTAANKQTKPTENTKKPTKKKEEQLPEWGQYQITGKDGQEERVLETFDHTELKSMIILFLLSGGIGAGYLFLRYRKRNCK